MAKKSTGVIVIEKPEDVEPWERQVSESSEAFQAWILYRDMEGKRSRRRVAEKLSISETLVTRWQVAHGWTERLRRWENHVDAEGRRAQIEAVIAFRKRAARQAMAKGQTLMLVDIALSKKLAKLGNDPEKLLAGLSTSALLQLATRGAQALPTLLRAEALALGDTTDRPELTTPKDSLSTKIGANDRLRSIAAMLIEEASTGGDTA